jgi:hypothetical protein
VEVHRRGEQHAGHVGGYGRVGHGPAVEVLLVVGAAPGLHLGDERAAECRLADHHGLQRDAPRREDRNWVAPDEAVGRGVHEEGVRLHGDRAAVEVQAIHGHAPHTAEPDDVLDTAQPPELLPAHGRAAVHGRQPPGVQPVVEAVLLEPQAELLDGARGRDAPRLHHGALEKLPREGVGPIDEPRVPAHDSGDAFMGTPWSRRWSAASMPVLPAPMTT